MEELDTIERFLIGKYLQLEKGVIRIPLEALQLMPRILQGRLLLDALQKVSDTTPIGKRQLDQILKLIDNQPGRHIEIGEVNVIRGREHLSFCSGANATKEGDFAALLTVPGKVSLDDRVIVAEWVDQMPEPGTIHRNEFYADADMVQLPLVVRTWKEGDRIDPLGLSGSKLVSDVLTDARYPSREKKSAIVVEVDGRILWVAGICRSSYACITEKSSRIVKLSMPK